MHTYFPSGICPTQILFDIRDGNVHNVSFVGGCHGNLQGVSRLVEGMPIRRVIETLEGITCGKRETSCPDQLAEALHRVASAN